MRMLFCAFRIINITLFALARCRLKWPSWSARRVFVDTCDKNRIRNCAQASHRLALGWVARSDLVQFLPVQVCRGRNRSWRSASISRCPSLPRPLGRMKLWMGRGSLKRCETIENAQAARSTKSSQFDILLLKKIKRF